MEFVDTDEGAALVQRFRDFGCNRVDEVMHRWCEWQLKKWGPEVALVMINRLLTWCTKNRPKDPPAAAIWMMLSGHERIWMPDNEYAEFRKEHQDLYWNYRRYLREHMEDGQPVTSKEAKVQSLRSELSLTPVQQGVEW